MKNEINYTKQLEQAGFSRKQAEAQLNILGMVMNEDLAKKTDIERLRSEVIKNRTYTEQAEIKLMKLINENSIAIKANNLAIRALSVKLDKIEWQVVKKLSLIITILLTIFKYFLK